MDLPIQWEGWRHHHWLLIRLALKTGDVTRIWSAYGEGGLAGLMGLSEEVHSPDDFRVPQVGWSLSGCPAVSFSVDSTLNILLAVTKFFASRLLVQVPLEGEGGGGAVCVEVA